SPKNLEDDLGHRRRRETKYLPALDDRNRPVVREHLGREIRKGCGAAAWHVQLVPVVPVGAHLETEKAAPVVFGVRLEHEGAAAVAEDHGAIPMRGAPGARLRRGRTLGFSEQNGPYVVRPRKERGVTLGAHKEDAAIRLGSDESV